MRNSVVLSAFYLLKYMIFFTGEEKIYEYVALVLMLTVAGWICHVIYYCTGHPWADINGPTFRKNPRSIHVPVFHCNFFYQFCAAIDKCFFVPNFK